MSTLEVLYDKYSDMLYRIALSELLNSYDAQDAVQDVFAKYIKASPRFHDDNHERAWFIKVTVNRCRDLLRHRNLNNHISLDEISELLSCEDDEIKNSCGRTIGCLSGLPDKYKTVIVLHYLEGFSVEEIAHTLKLSKSAVKMRLMRGREQIKNEMEDADV